MIHASKLPLLMERLGKDRRRVPFSLSFVKSTGELIQVAEAVCTSTYHANRTANIMLLPSKEVRTIPLISILRINNEDVFV